MTGEQLRFLKCVANETRLQILKLLEGEELCVCEIMEELNKEQSLISHHLQSLRECGLIQRRQKGRKIMYSLADSSVIKFLTDVEDLSRKFC